MHVPAICLLTLMICTPCSQAIEWHFAGAYGLICRASWRAPPSCRPCRPSRRLIPSWSWRGRVGIDKVYWFKGVSITDRQVDLVRGAFGFVLRLGLIGDETLIARPLGKLRLVNAASPATL